MRDEERRLDADQRRAAIAAWRALPADVRRHAVTTAQAGEPGPDPAVAEIGRRYALAVLTTPGPSWLGRLRWSGSWTPVYVGAAVLVLLVTFWSHSTGVAWGDLWVGPVLAVVALAFGALRHSALRAIRALAGRAPEVEGLSGGRPPSV